MKLYADERRQATPNSINLNDAVHMKQNQTNASIAPFSRQNFTVKAKKGTMVTATKGENTKSVARNASHFLNFSLQRNDKCHKNKY